MTRYYGLVLVPRDTPEEAIYDAAAELLDPNMRSEEEERSYAFDWYLQPDDLADDEEELAQYVWRAGDIIERFPELEIETIVTPDGQWHHSKSGVPNDNEWVEEARQVLQEHSECLALKHLFHI